MRKEDLNNTQNQFIIRRFSEKSELPEKMLKVDGCEASPDGLWLSVGNEHRQSTEAVAKLTGTQDDKEKLTGAWSTIMESYAQLALIPGTEEELEGAQRIKEQALNNLFMAGAEIRDILGEPVSVYTDTTVMPANANLHEISLSGHYVEWKPLSYDELRKKPKLCAKIPTPDNESGAQDVTLTSYNLVFDEYEAYKDAEIRKKIAELNKENTA